MITGPCTNILDRVFIEFHIISQQDRYALSIKRSKIYTYSLPTPADAEDVGSTLSSNVVITVLCYIFFDSLISTLSPYGTTSTCMILSVQTLSIET